MTFRPATYFLTTLFLVFFVIPAMAVTGDSITWLEAVAPPFFIHQGKLAGQGYEDVVTDIITEHLPQYAHKRTIANISRHYKEFQEGRHDCNVGLYKTPERQKFLYYSIPSFFTLPAVIIIAKKNFPRFGGTKVVNLKDILQKDLVIGRSSNRSYGESVDRILDTYGNSKNIFQYEGHELSLNFFKMLKLGRIDGLIGLPEEAMYQAERLGIRDRIMTLTIAENQKSKEAWFSYVVCPKNAWGKKVIDRVDAVLRQQRPTPRYRQAYERWLDESSLKRYRKLYKDVFLQALQ